MKSSLTKLKLGITILGLGLTNIACGVSNTGKTQAEILPPCDTMTIFTKSGMGWLDLYTQGFAWSGGISPDKLQPLYDVTRELNTDSDGNYTTLALTPSGLKYYPHHPDPNANKLIIGLWGCYNQ